MMVARVALVLYAFSFLGCEKIDDALDLSHSVTGTVRAASDNAPLEGVRVTIGGRAATSAANGTYTVTDLPKATLPLMAEKSGYTTLTGFVIVDELITQKNLSLQRP
ncbi:MAG TPA: carboxypeptidase-like regulatory domain-containing protein [Thermoanaerobaculia bacterium]|jgi:hypothetical protein